MKKIIALFFAFVATAGICFAADLVEGYWLSVDDKSGAVTAGWHIYEQGGKLYGKMVSMADYPGDLLADQCRDSYPGFPVAGNVSQMPILGTPWIFGLTLHRPGEWHNGHIINPEDGKIYRCKITYRAADGRRHKTDVLEMRGEIGLGIGRSQFWQKSDQAAASSLRPR